MHTHTHYFAHTHGYMYTTAGILYYIVHMYVYSIQYIGMCICPIVHSLTYVRIYDRPHRPPTVQV